MSSKARAIDLRRSTDRTFVHLLVNTLLVSVINFTMWFAVTFWVFLETHSVLATGMVAGIFLLTTVCRRLANSLRRRLHALRTHAKANVR
jgi:DHA3 family multidrug efflux protein-like MFS transporter